MTTNAVLEDWSTIESDIDNFMKGIKNRRLARERSELLKARAPILKKVHTTLTSCIPFANRAILASPGELLQEPSIQQILLDLPSNEVLTEENLLSAVVAVFPDVNTRIRRRIDDELFTRICEARSGTSGDNVALDSNIVFNLATTVFLCNIACSRKSWWYNEIISHLCTRRNTFPETVSDRHIIRDCLQEGYRSHANVEVDIAAMPLIAELIQLCGLDPATTTVQTMDDLNPIFECLRCSDQYAGRATMPWRTAVVCLPRFKFVAAYHKIY